MIHGGCQSGKKVVAHDSKSDFPLVNLSIYYMLCLFQGTRYQRTHQCPDWGPGPGASQTYAGSRPHGFWKTKAQRGMSPTLRCWHSSPWSTYPRHGHIRHVFPGGIPAPMGRTRPDCHHDAFTSDIWNLDHDFKNCAHIHGKTHVLWKTEGNASLFCFYRVPMSRL